MKKYICPTTEWHKIAHCQALCSSPNDGNQQVNNPVVPGVGGGEPGGAPMRWVF